MSVRTTTEVIQDHLSKRLAGDVEGDLATNFAEDVIMLSSFGVFRGHDGIHDSAKLLKKHLRDSIYTYNHTQIQGSYAFLEWSGTSDGTTVSDGADSFVVENGKIVMQTVHYTPRSTE